VTRVLLKNKADVEATMRRAIGRSRGPQELYAEVTALHLAAMEGHCSIVEMLLDSGADPEAKLRFTEESERKAPQERCMTPCAVAQEMARKGHDRGAVISLLAA